MYFIGYGCSFIPGPGSFRTAWGTQFIPCVLLMLGLPFLPRSPRWLAKVGREKEAIQVLADIQAKGDINDPLVVAEWEEISTTLRAERESVKGWRKFVVNGMWKRTIVGMTVQMWQQMSGANVIVYYIGMSKWLLRRVNAADRSQATYLRWQVCPGTLTWSPLVWSTPYSSCKWPLSCFPEVHF